MLFKITSCSHTNVKITYTERFSTILINCLKNYHASYLWSNNHQVNATVFFMPL